ncbi:ABC transporter ATP-binding protein [Parafrankia sp. FMc2]|uniref:ABC transporter ATP-binding protein n=1 Tax=Parafrankia sp. FMc2 TaxID=3233196 RepID=UPI0034D47AF7
MTTLRLAGIEVRLGTTTVLSGADLHCDDGEIVGLVGPNGSGKSTLLRTVYRMVRPVAGLVTVDGDDAWALSEREMARRTAVVVQETPAEFEFTAREIAAMGLLPHKRAFDRDTAADAAAVAAALGRVGVVGKLVDRPFATLSGGEKQRVLIARALVQRSRLLLLDEPTNHLDVRYQLEVLDLVAALGVSTVVCLHDLNLAASYCDQIFVVDGGRVVAGGKPADVLTPELILAVFDVRAAHYVHPLTGQTQLAFMSATAADAGARRRLTPREEVSNP